MQLVKARLQNGVVTTVVTDTLQPMTREQAYRFLSDTNTDWMERRVFMLACRGDEVDTVIGLYKVGIGSVPGISKYLVLYSALACNCLCLDVASTGARIPGWEEETLRGILAPLDLVELNFVYCDDY